MSKHKILPGEHLSPKTEFKKGCSSWNAGLKGMRLSPQTEFKKGNQPHNTRPILSERTATDSRSGSKAIYIKIANKHWIPKSHFIYKKHTGKEVPKGMVLYFVDGNYLNFDIKNLALISRGESCKRTKPNSKAREETMEGKHRRHSLTLKFNKLVSEGIVIMLKGPFPEVKSRIVGKSLILSNVHGDEIKGILATVKEEDPDFIHTVSQSIAMKDTRSNDQQSLLLALDNPDIPDLEAATICEMLIKKYHIGFYVANDGKGKKYIENGEICAKFEVVDKTGPDLTEGVTWHKRCRKCKQNKNGCSYQINKHVSDCEEVMIINERNNGIPPEQVNFEYINKTYKKTFKAGLKVKALGEDGILVKGTSHCFVRVGKEIRTYHPDDVILQEEVKSELYHSPKKVKTQEVKPTEKPILPVYPYRIPENEIDKENNWRVNKKRINKAHKIHNAEVPKMNKGLWGKNQKENERIKQYVLAGKTYQEIADANGLNLALIWPRIKTMGLKMSVKHDPKEPKYVKNKGAEQYREQIMKLVEQGKTNYQIDDIMKVSRGATRHRLISLGLGELTPKRTRGIPKKSLQELKKSVKIKEKELVDELDESTLAVNNIRPTPIVRIKRGGTVKKDIVKALINIHDRVQITNQVSFYFGRIGEIVEISPSGTHTIKSVVNDTILGKFYQNEFNLLPNNPQVICELANQCKYECDHWKPHLPIETIVRKCTDGGVCKMGFECQCIPFLSDAQRREIDGIIPFTKEEKLFICEFAEKCTQSLCWHKTPHLLDFKHRCEKVQYCSRMFISVKCVPVVSEVKEKPTPLKVVSYVKSPVPEKIELFVCINKFNCDATCERKIPKTWDEVNQTGTYCSNKGEFITFVLTEELKKQEPVAPTPQKDCFNCWSFKICAVVWEIQELAKKHELKTLVAKCNLWQPEK